MLFIHVITALIGVFYPPPDSLGTSPYKTVKMQFKPVFNQKTLVLDDKRYVTAASDTVVLSTFRFYISTIQCVFEDDSVYAEPNSYHLIDVEKEESLTFDLKNVPVKKLRFLNFTIGVDSLANVSGAQSGDLDPIKGMYWAWNTGYINAKIEGKSSSCKTLKNVFEFHIGGYLSPFNTMRKVQLQIKNVESDVLNIETDAHKWFSNIKLSETNSVLLPNKMAMTVADNYAQMFKIIETDGK